ncbi:hypothetical protein U9M48_013444 [Paspalum notatum var. saurae]|uniref:Uncharacterized protein n=1 Tax=Paspalum notatum var. saurae TaxID=547442 RepID=A0AAQ3WJA7_PASNO
MLVVSVQEVGLLSSWLRAQSPPIAAAGRRRCSYAPRRQQRGNSRLSFVPLLVLGSNLRYQLIMTCMGTGSRLSSHHT